MKMVSRLLLLGMLVAPQAAFAQVSGPHQFQFVGGSGVGFNGYQVGTYRGKLDGGATMNIWCTDFYNYAGNAQVYKTALGGPDLSKTRWGTLAGQPTLYQRAAYLTTQFRADNHSEWGYIQYAIWQMMNGGSPSAGLSTTASQKIADYQALALAEFGKYDYSGMFVLTDLRVTQGTGQGTRYAAGCQGVQGQRTCGIQEQLMGEIRLTDVDAVPEPATMGLLAVGLLGMAAAGRRRRR